MAGKRKRRTSPRRPASRRRGRRGPTLGQKFLVGLSGIVLVVCVASVTSGYIFRHHSGPRAGEKFRLEVLNGTTVQGLAKEVARALMHRGVDVLDVGNADRSDYERTILIARTRGTDVGDLAKLIGCRNTGRVEKPGSLVDATLILGADYQSLGLDLRLEGGLE